MQSNTIISAVKYLLLGLLLSFLLQIPAAGQEKDNASAPEHITDSVNEETTYIEENYNKYDNSDFIKESALKPITYHDKQLSQSNWNHIVGKDQYHYTLEKLTPATANNSWFKSFIDAISNFFNSDLGYMVAIIIIAFILILIIYFFVKNNKLIFRNAINQAVADGDKNAFETIPEDWIAAIQDAINNKDYKSAIAFQFRYLLVKLDGASLIQFQSHKTNTHYYYELMPSQQANQFQRLSAMFNEAKYGYKEINKESVSHFQLLDQQFQQSLHL